MFKTHSTNSQPPSQPDISDYVASLSEHTLTVNASTEHLSAVRDFVANHATEFGFEVNDVASIRLAVDEAYTNVIEHALKYDSTKSVMVSLGTKGDEFWIAITDDGVPFNPSDYNEPNIPERIKQRKRGGVGVYLIKRLMDKVEYNSKGSNNQIIMVKKR